MIYTNIIRVIAEPKLLQKFRDKFYAKFIANKKEYGIDIKSYNDQIQGKRILIISIKSNNAPIIHPLEQLCHEFSEGIQLTAVSMTNDSIHAIVLSNENDNDSDTYYGKGTAIKITEIKV